MPENITNDYEAPTISGTYDLDKEGYIKIRTYSANSSSGFGFVASGLVDGSGTVNTTSPQPIGNSGLYIKFPSSINSNISNWIIAIPNKNASDYLTNYNTYEAALSHMESTIQKYTAELALKKAQARGSDIDLAQADIISAEGQVQAAQAKYEDTIIRAPENGTITNIDIKLGELSEVQKPVITLQDVSNLYIEAKINESSIANLKIGQKVSIKFDAFGPSRVFNGNVVHIDPGATTTDGIVNYKIKTSITPLDESVRSGMNADIAITTAEKKHVLVIPKAAILSHDSKIYVNVITDKKHKKYKEQEVTTGLTGDGNLIEITSGLGDGTDIAIVSK
jgi:RND family efflux transporter MFP subunit